MKYIQDVRENDQLVDIYLCANKQVLKTRAGKTYYSLRLQDKSGSVDAKIWDLSDGIHNFEQGDYIKIDATVVSFQGSIQLNIRRLRVASEGEFEPKDYIPTTVYNIEGMYKELLGYIDSMDNMYLRKLANSFFVEDVNFAKNFKEHSAAKTVHHNFLGGLLEHTLGIIRICEFLANQYKELNKSLLYSGALFHDVGKLKELSNFPIVEYTDEGQLIGHIIIGVEWLTEKMRKIDGFPENIALLLKHMIIAHHGELEYGSPKKPAILEAIALHYADNIDAKMMTFTTVLNESSSEDIWTGYSRLFDSNLRRTKF